jgi:uncharacterized protein
MLKKLLLSFCLLISFFAQAQKAIPKPVPATLVVDNANLLTAEQKAILERKLIALDDSTSNQIVVLTVPSLNDLPIEEVATETFRAWGIGNKKTNNGILILVSTTPRKIRIEVGYGLEAVVTDVQSRDIIDRFLKPNFKEGNYFRGFDIAVDYLAQAAAGEYKVKRSKKGSDGGGSGIIPFIIIVVIIIIIVSNRGGRGGGGGYNRRRDTDFFTPFIIGNMLGNLGAGSSGGGGGGFSGGGFGGFGGGSSGGGGASGDW